MADEHRSPIWIKRYGKQRLYDTGSATYVTLDRLGDMVLRGQRFTVTEAGTGADITQEILRQLH
jgi:polyhydroxyalkanoate synthesis regulator protein